MSKVFTIAEGLENLGALRTGGQGSVYKGRRTGTIYSAVKLIPTPIHTESGDDKNYRNFQNEVAKLQKVNEIPNPNIVKILSSGVTESGSFPFIEMEYIEGPDLNELLAPPHEKIFTLKELLKVADQLACALAHCHKVGVKHGDIKSNNVKYNIHTGNYVLLDFGLAIMSEEQRRSSIRHAGAVEFMAPEQHEGKMLLQTDIYSYGVILYELLTGEVPFPLNGEGDSGRNAVMIGHMEAEVPDALRARKVNLPEDWPEQKMRQEMQVPAWLINLINKCLQKKPEDRYNDGQELHDAIVAGSLSAASGGGVNAAGGGVANANLAALKAENKKLQEQILELQSMFSTHN
jgi:serine/threonine protein kinase